MCSLCARRQATGFRTRWFGQVAAFALGTALGALLGPPPHDLNTRATAEGKKRPRRASAAAAAAGCAAPPAAALATAPAAAAVGWSAAGAPPTWASALRAVWVPATPLRLVRLGLRGEPGARLGAAVAACVRHLGGNLSLRVNARTDARTRTHRNTRLRARNGLTVTRARDTTSKRPLLISC